MTRGDVARRLALAVALACAACGGGPRDAKAPETIADPRERAACAGDPAAKESEPHATRAPLAGDLIGLPIVRVDFAGTRGANGAALRSLVGLREGAPLERAGVAAAIRALWASGSFEDVQVNAELAEKGVALVFLVRERPKVARVFAPNAPEDVRNEIARALGVEPGATWDPADLFERRRALEVGLAARGATFDLKTRDRPNNELDVCLLVGAGTPSAEARVKDWEQRSR